MNKIVISLFVFFLWIVAVFAFRPLGANNTLFEQSLYCVASLIASVSGFLVLRAYGKGPRFRSLLFLSLGVLAWFFADVQFNYYEFVLNNLSYPSSADYFYLAGYILMFLGLTLEIKLSDISWKKMNKQVYLVSGLFTALMLGAFSYLTLFSSYDPKALFWENVVTIGYTVGDLFLCVAGFFILVVAWEYRGGKASGVWMSLFLGFLSTMVGDLLYAIFPDALTSHVGWIYIVSQYFYIFGYILFTYAFLSLQTVFLTLQKRVNLKNTT